MVRVTSILLLINTEENLIIIISDDMNFFLHMLLYAHVSIITRNDYYYSRGHPLFTMMLLILIKITHNNDNRNIISITIDCVDYYYELLKP
jgi:hypothetical protein